MKKTISIFLTFILLISLMTGCNKAPANSDLQNVYNNIVEDTSDETTSNIDSKKTELFDKFSHMEFNTHHPYSYYPISAEYTYAYDKSLGFCLFVKEWDEYHLMPANWELFDAAFYGNIGFLVSAGDAEVVRTNTLDVVLFTKGSDEFVTYTIDIGIEMVIHSLYCNFTDSQNGFLFAFSEVNEQHFITLKTEDGGKSWYKIDCQNTPTAHWREYPTMAKFITSEIGFVAYRSIGNGDFCNRTYLTFDGGKTWTTLSGLQYSFDPISEQAEAFNLQYINGQYLLDVKVYDGKGGYYIHFYSTDLKSWSLAE